MKKRKSRPELSPLVMPGKRAIANGHRSLRSVLIRWHSSVLFLIIGLYLILNYGFMQVRVPPVASGGVPVGELLLLLSLAVINHFKILSRLSATILLAPFLLWWALGLGRAVAGVPEYELWALRDATHVIESLFLVVGFAVAFNSSAFERFFRWLPRILLAACIYAITVPFAELLKPLSPTLVAGGGFEIPLFFNYVSTPGLLIMAVAYLLLFKARASLGANAASIFLLVYLMLTFQARTVYLQIIAVALLLVIYKKELFGRWALGLLLLLALVALLPLTGLQISNRFGESISIEFLANHFLTIFGIEGEGVGSAAGGFDQRIDWWSDLYERWTASVENFFFGLGYGFPLIDFVAHGAGYAEEGQIVREPHNSYISIVARIGLVGAFAFVWMHVLLLSIWRRTYAMCRRMRWQAGQNRLLILMVFFILVWIFAIGEDAFEKPFFAIPYYFFWGVVLQMNWRLRNAHKNASTENAQEEPTGASARATSLPKNPAL